MDLQGLYCDTLKEFGGIGFPCPCILIREPDRGNARNEKTETPVNLQKVLNLWAARALRMQEVLLSCW